MWTFTKAIRKIRRLSILTIGKISLNFWFELLLAKLCCRALIWTTYRPHWAFWVSTTLFSLKVAYSHGQFLWRNLYIRSSYWCLVLRMWFLCWQAVQYLRVILNTSHANRWPIKSILRLCMVRRVLLNVLLSGCGSLSCIHTVFMNYLLAHPLLISNPLSIIVRRVSIHSSTLLALRLDILLIVVDICQAFFGMEVWTIDLFVTRSTINIWDPSSHRTRLPSLVIRSVWRLMASTRPLRHSHFLCTILLILIVINIWGGHVDGDGTYTLKRRVRSLLMIDPRRWWRQIRVMLMMILHLLLLLVSPFWMLVLDWDSAIIRLDVLGLYNVAAGV